MFDSPGLITAIAATENGTPHAALKSTFVPENRKRRTSPRSWTASSGQFEARTTSFALFAFVARRTSRSPNRTSPVSVATRRARDMSITGRLPPTVPPAPAGEAREPWRPALASGRPSASVARVAACKSGSPPRSRGGRGGPRGVDVRELENLREVRAFRVDDVAFPSLLDDRPRDPVDAFDLHCADLLDESLEFLERGLARLDDQGPGLPLHVPDLALDLLGLAEFLEPLLELAT